MSQGLKEKLFRGGIWALGGKIVSVICAFALNIVLARSLMPAEYGAYFVAFNTVIILATVGTLGVDQVAVRFTAIRIASGDITDAQFVIKRCLSIALVGGAIVCVIYYIFSPWFFTEVVKAPAVAAFSSLMALWIFLATLQRQLAETFRGLKDIRSATLFGGIRNNGVVISVVSACIALVLYFFDVLTLGAAYFMMCCSSLIVVILSARALFYTLRSNFEYKKTPSGVDNGITFNKIIQESWPLFFAATLGVLNMQGDGWLAAAFDTPENVALYGAAQRFVALVMAPLAIVNALLPPFAAELHSRGEFDRLERIARAVAGLAGLPAIIILIVFVLAGRQIMVRLFGEYYEASYPLLVLLGLGQLVNVLTGSCFIILAMTGHKRYVMLITTLSASILMIGGAVGGYYGGVLGVALISCLTTSLHNLLGMWCVYKELKMWTFISLQPSLFFELFKRIRGKRRRVTA